MPATTVTVFGGTGFLGREIVRTLARKKIHVRVAARRPGRVNFDEYSEHVRMVHCDLRDEATVAAAVEGADSVIDAVGLYVEHGTQTFDAVHIEGALYVARESGQAGAGRLVHISGIGASPTSASSYVRARAEGERRVKESFERAVIVRPSVLFGPGDAFLATLDRITRLSPVFPLFGDGSTRLQPVYVRDVAMAVARILDDASTHGKLYEVGGPRIHTYREVVEMVATYRGRKRMMLPLPYGVWTLQARVAGLLPNPPLTEDQVILMRDDNIVSAGAMSFEKLGIAPRSLEAMLPVCLED